jgi:branched-subunit amino acid transport protein
VSWAAILVLAAGVYATKALGPALLAGRPLPATAERMLALVAVPLLAALVLVQTLTDGRSYILDARLPAVLVAVIAVRLRAPFPVVVLLAAATCALLRAF